MQVVILAAGQGTRMRSGRPKVLQPLGGSSLLGHVLATARALGPKRLCVVFGHGGEAVSAAFPESDIRWVRQVPQLGTGHAVRQALPELDASGVVLVLYGDVPLLSVSTLRALVAMAGDAERLALLTAHVEDPTGYGRIVRDSGGGVVRIVEHKDATPDERAIREINTGIMALPGACLADWLGRLNNDNAQSEYYLTDLIALAAADRVDIVASHPSVAWETLGVNDKAQLAQVERILQREIAQGLLASGVTLRDPERIDVRGSLDCGKDVEVDVGCVFEGRVALGDGVRVGSYCVLRDVEVAAGTHIAAFSHLDGSQIGPDCRVGPYARLRPGTVLAAEAHIGNFVEIKNSVIGTGSKANHLAYVGDASVGSNVNIGAGTITCNYDGANKHRTVIEDDVFIGSDTQLVAPVTVGRGATLGAGTTLTRDAPAGALTLSRARQTTIEGWKRPRKSPS